MLVVAIIIYVADTLSRIAIPYVVLSFITLVIILS